MVSRLVQTFEDGELVSEHHVDMSWKQIRRMRDNELETSDWRFMSDQSPSDEWVAYRVFLRDLPQNHESANEAADVWDEYVKPEGA